MNRNEPPPELVAEARAARRRARHHCTMCRTTGGHMDGCPEADDDLEDDQ